MRTSAAAAAEEEEEEKPFRIRLIKRRRSAMHQLTTVSQRGQRVHVSEMNNEVCWCDCPVNVVVVAAASSRGNNII